MNMTTSIAQRRPTTAPPITAGSTKGYRDIILDLLSDKAFFKKSTVSDRYARLSSQRFCRDGEHDRTWSKTPKSLEETLGRYDLIIWILVIHFVEFDWKLCHFYTHRLVRLAAQRTGWCGPRISDSWCRPRRCRRCCRRDRLPCLRARLRWPRYRVGSRCQWSSGNWIRLDHFNPFNSRSPRDRRRAKTSRVSSNKNIVICSEREVSRQHSNRAN